MCASCELIYVILSLTGTGSRTGKILQRFPEKDWADTPFIEGIEWVCTNDVFFQTCLSHLSQIPTVSSSVNPKAGPCRPSARNHSFSYRS